jgi:hypothetical protein
MYADIPVTVVLCYACQNHQHSLSCRQVNPPEHEDEWASRFSCRLCGPCTPEMVRTDKCCTCCGQLLIRHLEPLRG